MKVTVQPAPDLFGQGGGPASFRLLPLASSNILYLMVIINYMDCI